MCGSSWGSSPPPFFCRACCTRRNVPRRNVPNYVTPVGVGGHAALGPAAPRRWCCCAAWSEGEHRMSSSASSVAVVAGAGEVDGGRGGDLKVCGSKRLRQSGVSFSPGSCKYTFQTQAPMKSLQLTLVAKPKRQSKVFIDVAGQLRAKLDERTRAYSRTPATTGRPHGRLEHPFRRRSPLRSPLRRVGVFWRRRPFPPFTRRICR